MVLTFATTIILHSPVQTDNLSSSVHVITQEKAIDIIIIRCVINNQRIPLNQHVISECAYACVEVATIMIMLLLGLLHINNIFYLLLLLCGLLHKSARTHVLHSGCVK